MITLSVAANAMCEQDHPANQGSAISHPRMDHHGDFQIAAVSMVMLVAVPESDQCGPIESFCCTYTAYQWLTLACRQLIHTPHSSFKSSLNSYGLAVAMVTPIVSVTVAT